MLPRPIIINQTQIYIYLSSILITVVIFIHHIDTNKHVFFTHIKTHAHRRAVECNIFPRSAPRAITLLRLDVSVCDGESYWEVNENRFLRPATYSKSGIMRTHHELHIYIDAQIHIQFKYTFATCRQGAAWKIILQPNDAHGSARVGIQKSLPHNISPRPASSVAQVKPRFMFDLLLLLLSRGSISNTTRIYFRSHLHTHKKT